MDPVGVKYITPKKHYPLNYVKVTCQFSLNSDIKFEIHKQIKCLVVGVALVGNGPASPLTPKLFVFQSQQSVITSHY